MMSKKAGTTLILLVGLAAASLVQSSAIKGQQPQVQPVQRLEESAVRAPIKSPVQQHSERSPKSSSVVAPVLESSKKVYNDESIRRSVGQQALAEPAAVKSAPLLAEPSPVAVAAAPVAPLAPVVVEHVQPPAAPVAPIPIPIPVSAPAPVPVAAPVVPVKEAAPAASAAPVAPAAPAAPVAPAAPAAPIAAVVPPQAPAAIVQPQPVAPIAASPVVPIVEPMKPTFVEQPAAPIVKDELPAQSERSAPIKDEPIVKVAQAAPSAVVVEHVVPAKVPLVEPVAAPAAKVEPAADSPLMAKKDEVVAAPAVKEAAAAAAAVAEPIEVPAPDPGLVLSEPIDSTTKLLIDLDEHVQKFLPAEDKQEPAQPAKDQVLVSGVDYSPEAQPSGKSSAPLVPYSSTNVVDNDAIVPPLPSLEKVEKASGAQAVAAGSAAAAPSASGQSATRQANHQHQNQQQVITQLLDQLDSLQTRIQDTINQLVARRRYVMSALLRPMGTYVRRVRTNLERLQNRVNQLQAAAVSVGGNQNGNRPGGFVDAAAIETIRRRIDDISKRISDIVNRIRFSLTPTSAPLNNNGRK